MCFSYFDLSSVLYSLLISFTKFCVVHVAIESSSDCVSESCFKFGCKNTKYFYSECECETNLMKSEVSLHDGHLLKFNRLYFVFLEETAGNVKLNNYES